MMMLPNGTKRTSPPSRGMSAIGGKADIVGQGFDVRKADIGNASADIPIKGRHVGSHRHPSRTDVARLLHGLEIKAPRAALLVSAGYRYA